MALTSGARLGPYEILSPLGQGGMGEVYRARDTKLKRDVAIKVVPEEFSEDPDRLARFQREAEVLASLNHPNIAAIYGVEEASGTRCLVMELVEGPTLAERVARGPLPVEEALPIAQEIAEGLEAAHERGVIHRDLKPANIKLTPDGKVKVLDFGLAKALERAPAENLSQSPTILPAGRTQANVILGTAAYMSPEQARGQVVDARSDVWSFGCVLYEMLTSKPPFGGETVPEVLAGILKAEPDWGVVTHTIPPTIRSLLRRCLQKDRRHRLRDIADARIEIAEALRDASLITGVTETTRRSRRVSAAWTVAGAAAIVVTAASLAGLFLLRQPVSEAPEVRLQVNTPPTGDPVSMAISPDGRRLVFMASSAGRNTLWLRPLKTLSAEPLAGTADASYPFWSPDGRSIGFFADGKLKRIDVEGGAVQILANAAPGRGGTWNRDGVILFAASSAVPIMRVAATGGAAVPVTTVDRPKQSSHRFPCFLPDGDHFLFSAQGTPEVAGIYLGSLADPGRKPTRLLETDANAIFLPPRHLLFVRQSTLFAQPFDTDRLELAGDPLPLGEQVDTAGEGIGAFSASTTGEFAYRSGGASRKLQWFDRSGRTLGEIGGADSSQPSEPELSPDGRRVVLQRTVNGNPDVWVLDVMRGVLTRFTFHPANELSPIWSRDGRAIVFGSNRKGIVDLYQKASNGAGAEELFLESPLPKLPTDFSPDGRFVLYRQTSPDTGRDLWVLPRSGDRKPFPVVNTPFEERDGQFSPDGRWIAYMSNESGQFEIYVQPFPDPGGKWQISTTGGGQPRWRPDGKELFYISLDGKLMAATTALSAAGQTVEAGAPQILFPTRIVGWGLQSGTAKQQYAVSSDGQRFLMNVVPEDVGASSPITLVLNWNPRAAR